MNELDMMSPSKVAEQYGGDKRKIAQAAQMGLIDPTVAVMAGMFIDRMRGAAAKEQQPQTTVAQDIMVPRGVMAAQAAPVQGGIDALPVSEDMVPNEYAGGGIIAFEDGGRVPQYQGMTDGSFIDLENIRMGKKKSPFEDAVIQNSLARGEDPSRALEILYRETGGLSDPSRATSRAGAKGVLQVMPSTAMNPGYGLPSIFDLAKARGIQFGEENKETASKLLENPDLNIEFGSRYRSAMEQQFKDPILAAAAFNAGPGSVTRAGNQVPDIAETKKYVEGISPQRANFIQRQEAAAKKVQAARRNQLASGTLEPQGPIIPGQSVMAGEGKPTKDYGSVPPPYKTKEEGLAQLDKFGRYLSGETPLPGATVAQQMLKERLAKEDKGVAAEEATGKKDKEGKEGKAETYGDKLERLLSEREGRLAARQEENRNLALLAAGLGIMGGKSRYALENVGTGAMKGVEQYAAAQKQLAKEEEDILAGRLGQYRYGEESRLRAEDKRLNQGMTLASMEEKRIRDNFQKILSDLTNPTQRNALLAKIKADPDYIEKQAIFGRNRILQKYGIGIDEDMQPANSSTMIDYGSIAKKK